MARRPSGRRPSGKTKVASGRTASGRRSSRRASGRPSARGIKVKKKPSSRAPAAGGAAGAIPVICGDCGEEYMMNPSADADALICFECEHPGKVPSDDFLREFYGRTRTARGALMTAIVPGILMMIVGLVWVWVGVTTTGEIGAISYAFPGLIVILLVITIVFGNKYEKSRWDAYF